MNPRETKALRWIANATGYRTDQIKFTNNRSPDFTTPDGQGFEVKTLKFHGIDTWPRQWDQLKALRRCTILVFSEGEEPEAIIPIAELPDGPSKWEDISIRFLAQCPGSTERTRLWSEYVADCARMTRRVAIREGRLME